MSSQLAYNVYVGWWINWAKGAVLGSTLTLSARNGAIFQNFLVIFVEYAGVQSWKILRFLLHHHRVHRRISVRTTKPEEPPATVQHKDDNGLYYQQQVVLRNESSDRTAIWDFISLAFRWQSKLDRATRQSSHLIIIAVLHAAAWIAAALFVSRVANTSNPSILLRPASCGYASLSFDTKEDRDNAFYKIRSDMKDAWTYAQSCYVPYPIPVGCMMPTQEFFASGTENITCPFPGLCLYSDTAAIQYDTGLINSNVHFGINAPPSEQVNYERITTCAPLNTSSFESLSTATSASAFPIGDLLEVFDLGPNSDYGNFTYEYDTHGVNATKLGYQIYPVAYFYVDSPNFWFPSSSQFNHSDADTTIIFLAANSIRYPSPVDDPIFAAHVAYNVPSLNMTYYLADNYVTAISCVEQHQYCLQKAIQGDQYCTGLSSANDATDNLYSLWSNSEMTDAQWDTAGRIAATANYSTLYWTVGSRMASSLNASDTVMGLVQTAELPDNQWMYEVSHWLATSYAYLQQTVVQYASGQNNYDLNTIITPTSPYQQEMCHKQVLKSFSGYTSFSFLGVALIIVIGTIIIAIGSSIGHIAASTWPNRRHRDDRQLGQFCSKAWNLDNKFQLQRTAFEGQSRGTWEKDDNKEIPLTTEDEEFEYFSVDAPGPKRQYRKRWVQQLPVANQNGVSNS